MSKAAEKIGELMVGEVLQLSPEVSVREAVIEMVALNVGSVVVVKEERLVGIFTERDALRRLLDRPTLLEDRLGDVMTPSPTTISPGIDVYDAFEIMADHGFRRLPVVEGERLVGIVTENDLLRWMRDVANE